MIENFQNQYERKLEDRVNMGLILADPSVTDEDKRRVENILRYWNFYEGFHWEEVSDIDTPEVTFNYCRAFVNKYVSFEFGRGFIIKTSTSVQNTPVTVNDKVPAVREMPDSVDMENGKIRSDIEKKVEQTEFDFLEYVWTDNNRNTFCVELGQTKSVTGMAWVQVGFVPKEDLDDPFEEYPNGRIRVVVQPTQYCYPEFDQHDKNKLVKFTLMYVIEEERPTGILFKSVEKKKVLYKEVWTKDNITIYKGSEQPRVIANKYKVIPFIGIKNYPIAGKPNGVSDLEDLIPLNVELNLKKSDISEIIDYHSAPITCVFGAKIGNLEKGANKVWGGLPKDAKVSNLELKGDLGASMNYVADLKTSMCEIGGCPETVLGGSESISNTSGVALQYMNLPLIERTNIKRACTEEGLKMVNKMIIYIGIKEGLIVKPENVTMRDFLSNEVTVPDTLPKDQLLELQQIEQEMRLSLESRHGAMERLGRDDIENKIAEIDAERQVYTFSSLNDTNKGGSASNTNTDEGNDGSGKGKDATPLRDNQINSGMTNGQTPKEQKRIELTGKNGTPKNEKSGALG